jgi:hypothetical protein
MNIKDEIKYLLLNDNVTEHTKNNGTKLTKNNWTKLTKKKLAIKIYGKLNLYEKYTSTLKNFVETWKWCRFLNQKEAN